MSKKKTPKDSEPDPRPLGEFWGKKPVASQPLAKMGKKKSSRKKHVLKKVVGK